MADAAQVDNLVQQFYASILTDIQLNRFFTGIDMSRQISRMSLAILALMGMGGAIDAEALRLAHAPLVQRGLSDAHFDRVLVHLRDVLRANNVAPDIIESLESKIEKTRNLLLGRA